MIGGAFVHATTGAYSDIQILSPRKYSCQESRKMNGLWIAVFSASTHIILDQVSVHRSFKLVIARNQESVDSGGSLL